MEKHEPFHEAHTPIFIHNEEIDSTYENTTLYEFGNGFEGMNHVYITNVLGRRAILLYHSFEILNKLKEADYPLVFSPEPSANEVDAYVDFQNGTIDRDWEAINKKPGKEE